MIEGKKASDNKHDSDNSSAKAMQATSEIRDIDDSDNSSAKAMQETSEIRDIAMHAGSEKHEIAMQGGSDAHLALLSADTRIFNIFERDYEIDLPLGIPNFPTLDDVLRFDFDDRKTC